MDESQFFTLEGMIHEISLSPTGGLHDPWPFCLSVSNGHDEAAGLIYQDDAQAIIDFLTKQMEV